ncbi:putative lipoprotein [Leptospira sp. P2653]|uniref:NADase-type glycan-binding domain-containing protein n=1 Tax=Leptospira sp. P2653 TaxID=1218600 RepID=UPI0002C0091D|nr:putative lipoprotein [Leptospira sp. P2653]EMJ60827.1 putative lipoprotein [Leptospira sp. P2653]
MNPKIHFLFTVSFLVFVSVSCKKELSVSMATSTSLSDKLAFAALGEGGWKPEVGAEFVKLHFYPDEGFQLKKMEVDSCKGEFTDAVTVYINFDELSATANLSNQKEVVSFEKAVFARSVTINFRKNKDLCIGQIRFYDEKDKQFSLKLPKIVEGSVIASDTLSPVSSYDVMNLFDSRYEYAWASDDRKGKGVGVTLDFRFSERQTITKIKIWNGYQRSDQHCYSNGRLKEATLTGDNGYNQKIQVQDILGPQEIQLEKPFEGKNLRLTVTDIYAGKMYKGIVLSEIRFGEKKNWILIDPIKRSQSIAESNHLQFTASNLDGILNRGLKGSERSRLPQSIETIESSENGTQVAETINSPSTTVIDESNGVRTESNWTLRMRSDGSFFMEGNIEDQNDAEEGTLYKTSKFYAIGNYEVKESSSEALKLRVFGYMRKYSSTFMEQHKDEDMDCNGCGRDCNMGNQDPNKKEIIFQDFITIKNLNGNVYVQNTSPSRKLDFQILEMTLE